MTSSVNGIISTTGKSVELMKNDQVSIQDEKSILIENTFCEASPSYEETESSFADTSAAYVNNLTEQKGEAEAEVLETDISNAQAEQGGIIDFFDGDSKDGKIDDAKQHSTGDCWLLSAVNALSYTEEGREIIEECLDYKDDYTVVHLATGDVTVTDNEVAKTKGSSQYSSGDDDMIIFELAIEKVLDDIANGNIELSEDAPYFLNGADDLEATTWGNSSTEGGMSIQALYYITGITGSRTHDKDEMNEELDKYAENNGQNYVLAASVNSKSENGEYESVYAEDVNGEQVELGNPHAYAIKNVDEDTVTVINPQDPSEEIALSRETFLAVFSSIDSLDLTQESNDGEYYI